MVQAVVRDLIEYIRKRGHAAAAETAAGPGLRLPGDNGAVFFCADLNVGEGGRTDTGDGEFRLAVEEHFDGFAAALLGELRAYDAPAVGRKLSAETAAHVIHLDADVGSWNFEVFSQIAAYSGYGLRGRPIVDLIALHGNDLPMRFQAAVSDYGNGVEIF